MTAWAASLFVFLDVFVSVFCDLHVIVIVGIVSLGLCAFLVFVTFHFILFIIIWIDTT